MRLGKLAEEVIDIPPFSCGKFFLNLSQQTRQSLRGQLFSEGLHIQQHGSRLSILAQQNRPTCSLYLPQELG